MALLPSKEGYDRYDNFTSLTPIDYENDYGKTPNKVFPSFFHYTFQNTRT